MTRPLVFALGAALALLLTASALAAPKPWQWTPAQAAAAIRVYGEDLYVPPNFDPGKDLVRVTCRGTGKRVQGRFAAFRCPAIFEPSGNLVTGQIQNKAVIVARTRRAGGLCFAYVGAIPRACFAPGKRATGSVDDAFRAMVQKVGTQNQAFRCVANGSGFFSCSWLDAAGRHRGTVVFTPRPVVRVLA